MPKLILLRHFKSQWNEENRFSGWVDMPLAKDKTDAEWQTIKRVSAMDFDVVYTSPLVRNSGTVLEVFESMNQKYPIFRHFDGKMQKWADFTELNHNYLPVYVSEALNERYYGKLQGLNKEETIKKYGEDKVRQWRRGFNQAPPGGESLKDVCRRVYPFFQKYIEKDLKEGKNVLVVASHNSLRAIIKYVEKIPDNDIINKEVPFGGLLQYNYLNKTYAKS